MRVARRPKCGKGLCSLAFLCFIHRALHKHCPTMREFFIFIAVSCGGGRAEAAERNFFRLIKRLYAPSIWKSGKEERRGCLPADRDGGKYNIDLLHSEKEARAKSMHDLALSLFLSLGKWPAQLDVFPKCNCHAYFTAILLHLHPIDPRTNGERAVSQSNPDLGYTF